MPRGGRQLPKLDLMDKLIVDQTMMPYVVAIIALSILTDVTTNIFTALFGGVLIGGVIVIFGYEVAFKIKKAYTAHFVAIVELGGEDEDGGRE